MRETSEQQEKVNEKCPCPTSNAPAPEQRAPLCSDSVCRSPKTLPACLAVELGLSRQNQLGGCSKRNMCSLRM